MKHRNYAKDLSEVFLSNCNDFVFILDLKFKIIGLSSVAKKLLRARNQNLLGQEFFALAKRKKISLSFTADDLDVCTKAKKHNFLKGCICKKGKQTPILWKCLFVSDKKCHGYFLIIGKGLPDFVMDEERNFLSKQLDSVQENNILISTYLNNIIESLPEYIYWKDIDLVYRGCNKRVSDSLDLPSPGSIVGKTDKDFGWSEDRVKVLNDIDKHIIKTGITSMVEDVIPLPDGSVRIMLSSKEPLRDVNNRIIGIIGISVDITDQKRADQLQREKDRLAVENKLHKKIIVEQDKFRKIANQVAHDIQSPLASLLMMLEFCKNIPNSERVSLRAIAASISDIVSNLLDKYKQNNGPVVFDDKGAQGILVSLVLLEILSEKKYQYKNLNVDFDYNFKPNAVFGVISYSLIDFKRMISNLINNSVDAFAGYHGTIKLGLAIQNDNILVTVRDNGRGMPEKVVRDIMNNVVVASNKPEGSGLGLTQVRDMLASNRGKILVDSKVGKGTAMTLIFSQVAAPTWLVKSISLVKGDLVLVLDDDLSIHNVWQLRLKSYPEIKIKCFAIAKDLLDFFDSLTIEQKHHVFLLSDFDLGDQDLDGLQVIRHCAQYISVQDQVMLVTSHYNNQDIIDFVSKKEIRILPKQLIQYAPLEVLDIRGKCKDIENYSDVNLVIIDDDKMFADSLTGFFQAQNMQVNTYYNPQKFLDDLHLYKKDTKVFMDNDFKSQMTGMELAKILHEARYTKLYMLSGSDFDKDQIPGYLNTIIKGDLESLKKII